MTLLGGPYILGVGRTPGGPGEKGALQMGNRLLKTEEREVTA